MSIIIDVHAHIFNALDIPLKGYLESRSSEQFLEKYFGKFIKPKLAKCIRSRLTSPRRNPGERFWCDFLVKNICRAMGKGYYDWAQTLSKPVSEITRKLLEDFEEDEIDLYVPLMIDYEYWFKNTPDTLLKTQIDRIYEEIILPYKGRIHPFVPFDPARELAFRHGLKTPDGIFEDYGSLDLLKDAIENKGFIGVKLYPALGYKPFWNEDVERERKGIPNHKDYYAFSGGEYDEVLSELYDYCIAKEIPITAHCVMDGIESYKNASWHFGQAKFWREVLVQERFKKLRLNLAHFGWHKKQGYGGDQSWVEQICRMMERFDTLYTDVSHHRVVNDSYRDKFVADYKKIFTEHPVVKERLLFGIDWHVIQRVEGYRNFPCDYLSVMRACGLTPAETEAFSGGNAVKFLGLANGGQNRARLEQFYHSRGFSLPQWWNKIDESHS